MTRTLKEIIKEAVISAMLDAENNVAKAARILGVGRATVYRRLKEYGMLKRNVRSIR
jgi:transcriptional regulator of acetoin/glycerol metabolism